MPPRPPERWYDASPGRSWLEPLGWLYGALVAARRRAYAAGLLRSGRAGCPVIVIGNLTVGGTGKTPLTLWLAAQLQARGFAVGILSRGYGRADRAVRVVQADSRVAARWAMSRCSWRAAAAASRWSRPIGSPARGTCTHSVRA